ncbi:hypothetical protein AK830_g8637 [Neonectria ditissima]|uniref:3'-5' exonuclease domain-containing protein n=1 Tax=Neonectria ditissima TaxID=78410 RepID=A0A0P7ATU5_9HYPO|nr:hypothetical protein AK830_g8637 [Neonectria ditissima]
MSSEAAPSTLVDTVDGIVSLVDAIKTPTATPSLFVDLEGVSLSRHGSISILTIYVLPERRAYLVDVHTLGAAAFTTASADGTTLKAILESASIAKVFFDVRNDSDALHAHYGVALSGVEDVQLMENAARPGRRRFVVGLERTVREHAGLTAAQARAWSAAKERGAALFSPAKGGSYQVFNRRPLDADVERYCVNDVQYLPGLRDVLWGKLGSGWRRKVVETGRRVRESQAAVYDPQSESKKFGPWPAEQMRWGF